MLKDALYNRFINPLKREAQDFVGIELEYPIVNLNKQAVDQTVCQKLTEAFVHHFGFTINQRDDEGFIYHANNSQNNDLFTFDCSYNTLEFSFGVVRDIHDAEQRFIEYYSFVQNFLKSYHYTLTGMGINPYYMYNQYEPIANERYRMLYHYLKSYQKYNNHSYHHYPEFGMFSCASQVQLDVNTENVIDVINAFNQLEPYKSVLFANSPFDDYYLARDYLWESSMHGYNPHNVGLYDHKIKDIDDLLDDMTKMSLYNVVRDGHEITFTPITLNEFFKLDHVNGEYYDGRQYRLISFQPQLTDIKYLRAYKLEDLTHRGTIEFRSCCTQPVHDTFSIAAFHAGLLDQYQELQKLLDSFDLFKKYSIKEARASFNKGIYDIYDQNKLKSDLINILDLAKKGLADRGYHEEAYLDPLYQRVSDAANPAKIIKEGSKDIEYYINKYSQ